MSQNNIEQQLQFLKVYAVLLTLICAVLFGIVFKVIYSKKFEEIDVERINVIEKDGKLRMVISNKSRQHPGAALRDQGLLTPSVPRSQSSGRPPKIYQIDLRSLGKMIPFLHA